MLGFSLYTQFENRGPKKAPKPYIPAMMQYRAAVFFVKRTTATAEGPSSRAPNKQVPINWTHIRSQKSFVKLVARQPIMVTTMDSTKGVLNPTLCIINAVTSAQNKYEN